MSDIEIHEIPDLWPSTTATVETVAPIAILKQQANLLKKRTNGLIGAAISTLQHPTKATHLAHTFSIEAYNLNYTYELFTVSHGIKHFYSLELQSPVINKGRPLTLNNEQDFLDALRTIFSNSETQRVIANLLSQCQA